MAQVVAPPESPVFGSPPEDETILCASDTLPMAPAPPVESRAAPRFERRFVVRMRRGPPARRRCLCRDGSTEGIFVLMPGAPAVGATVDCVLVHPEAGRELTLRARVVRAGETLAGPGVGLAFERMSTDQRQRLRHFVEPR